MNTQNDFLIQQKLADRLPYHTPVLEEYGDLSELTQGWIGGNADPFGGQFSAYPKG